MNISERCIREYLEMNYEHSYSYSTSSSKFITDLGIVAVGLQVRFNDLLLCLHVLIVKDNLEPFLMQLGVKQHMSFNFEYLKKF